MACLATSAVAVVVPLSGAVAGAGAAPGALAPSDLAIRGSHQDPAVPPGNMTYHAGPILHTVATKAVFWGPSWNNSAYVEDKMVGLDAFYSGISGSKYAKTVDEYTDTVGPGHRVGPSIVFAGHVIDVSTASDGANVQEIAAEVTKLVTNGLIPLVKNLYVPVYTDLPRGSAPYCGWHSATKIGSHWVQFAFFWSLDGDSQCSPSDTQTTHTQGLGALANVSAHELSEARTDPRIGGWYDSRGNESADKCAWTFHVPYVSFANGTVWKLQGEWSNNAFTAGTGYPNSNGQPGCLDGH